MLGYDEGVTYRKAELNTFVSLGLEDQLGEDELSLLGSVLEFAEKKVGSVMVRCHVPRVRRSSTGKLQTPSEDVYKNVVSRQRRMPDPADHLSRKTTSFR